ncbi:MAG: radical SAM protein, partial [Candidatus Omnitrophota bacterium]
MCYAIPGKVVEVQDTIVTVDYFGERKKARNEFYTLIPGEYVYAQGGFVVQKVSEKEALPVLESWKELFFKLQEVDFTLARESKTLYQRANNLRQKHHGNSCCVHGIIEFSNYCAQNCLYCGIRAGNGLITRYRMSPDEIISTAVYAVRELGFKALVLQAGEDTWYNDEILEDIVLRLRNEAPCLIVLSVGERSAALYERLYRAGARAILMRFESSNASLYERMRPGRFLEQRIALIKELHTIGYLVMTGFLIGLPGQTPDDLAADIKLT